MVFLQNNFRRWQIRRIHCSHSGNKKTQVTQENPYSESRKRRRRLGTTEESRTAERHIEIGAMFCWVLVGEREGGSGW
jgi:hypothetical protein